MFHKYFDFVYIINLKKDIIRRELCLKSLNNNNIHNYKFIEAVNTVTNPIYNKLYDSITKNMDPLFIKNNFTKGALGCLLSHIKCLNHAKKNNYKKILILEDDFIAVQNFNDHLKKLFDNIDDKWDLMYLGKKQGNPHDKIDIHEKIHTEIEKYTNTKPINDFVYSPNYRTWATHALLIKNIIFDDIIELSKNITGPIDLLLMTLYSKYTFYCVNKDLFITYEEFSNIQSIDKKNIWNWDYSIYQVMQHHFIENVIIYGFKNSDHTHHYIHNMYYDFLKYYYPYLKIHWYDDIEPISNTNLTNVLIICSPCHHEYINLPKRKDIFYILHLDEFDNLGYKNVDLFLNAPENYEIVNSKKYIILLCREIESGLKYFEKNITDCKICLPWFSNKFYSDIMCIKNNLRDICKKNISKKYLCFMGSIWSINIKMIKKLINICNDNKIYLILKGRIFDLSEEDKKYLNNLNSEYVMLIKFEYKNNGKLISNTFEYIDNEYGVKGLLPLQGSDHNTNYISNRIFETVTNGYLAITNNTITKKYFKSVIYNDDLNELLKEYIQIMSDENKYFRIMEQQLNEMIEKFYGYKNISTLFDFLKGTCSLNGSLPLLNYNMNYKNIYKLWFVNDPFYTNKYYSVIKTNELIREGMCHLNNYIIYPNHSYDIFLLEQIISLLNYNTIQIDDNYRDKDLIIHLCNKHHKDYIIKKPLKIICLLSGQRTGSTLVIDYFQKNETNVLALSEIFNYYNNDFTYLHSYDVKNKNGVLYDETLSPIKNENVQEYFKQYEDIANYRDNEIIIFKLTFDYLINIDQFTLIEKILKFIQSHHLIYLDRNDIECYISKKFALIYGHANSIYKEISNDMFSYTEFFTFIKNKIEINKKIFAGQKHNIKTIHYQDIVNHYPIIKNLNSIFKEYNNGQDLIEINKYNTNNELYNEKQNAFSLSDLLNEKYWS